jgi:hypothetical protein
MPNFDRPAERITLTASAYSAAFIMVEYCAYPYGSPMRIDTFHISQSPYPNTPSVISIDLDRPASESRVSERIDNRAVHISSTAPISLSGYSMNRGSGEGFLALPLATLGKEYYTVNYPSFQFTESLYYPGEFLIVAPFDGTKVKIVTSAYTRDSSFKDSHKPGDTLSVTLGRGQTYLVQSSTSPFQFPTDLTGTHIISNMPISVLSGHAYTKFSMSDLGSHVIEMLPPVESWSTKYYYAKFDADPLTSLMILAADTGTFYITSNQVNKYPYAELKPGEHSEEFIDPDDQYGVLVISENQSSRFLVTELRRSDTKSNSSKKPFHPTISVVTSPGQRDSICLVNAPARIDSVASDYAEEFFYNGTDSDLTGTFGKLNVRNLRYIPSSPHQLIYHPDPEGVHGAMAVGLASGHPIVAMTAGTSGDISYSHPSSFTITKHSTDHLKPKISFLDDPFCGNYNISITDSVVALSPESGKLAAVRPVTGLHDYNELPPVSNYRIVTANDFVAGSSRYDLKLEVVDRRKDAFAAIYTQDLSGNDTAFVFSYTAGRTQLMQSGPKSYKIPVGRETCQTIAFAPRIDSLSSGPIYVESVLLQSGMSNPYIKLVAPNLPRTLDKGDTLYVTICANASDTLHSITDSIVIFADCYDRLYPFNAKGVTGLLDAGDVAYGEIEANVTIPRDIKLINHGEIPLSVTGFVETGSTAFSGIAIPSVNTVPGNGYLYIKNVRYFQPLPGIYDTAVIHWKTDVAPPYENSIKTYSILTASTKPQSGVRSNTTEGFTIVSVNPNPAQSSFTLHYISSRDLTLHLYDALGRDVFTTALPSGENRELITLPSLASGSYLIRLASSEGIRERTLVITR